MFNMPSSSQHDSGRAYDNYRMSDYRGFNYPLFNNPYYQNSPLVLINQPAPAPIQPKRTEYVTMLPLSDSYLMMASILGCLILIASLMK